MDFPDQEQRGLEHRGEGQYYDGPRQLTVLRRSVQTRTEFSGGTSLFIGVDTALPPLQQLWYPPPTYQRV